MTRTDKESFAALLKFVAVTFNKKLVPEMVSAYYEALQHVPLKELEIAARTLQRTARYWPKPVEWLDACQKTRPQPPPVPRDVLLPDGTTETTFYCRRCEDTGWAPECGCAAGTLDHRRHCPRHPYEGRDGLSHARPVACCACRGSNPYWQANHPRRYSEERA